MVHTQARPELCQHVSLVTQLVVTKSLFRQKIAIPDCLNIHGSALKTPARLTVTTVVFEDGLLLPHDFGWHGLMNGDTIMTKYRGLKFKIQKPTKE
jgi:hypothetical protein